MRGREGGPETDRRSGRSAAGPSRIPGVAASGRARWHRRAGPPIAVFLVLVSAWQAWVVAFEVPAVVLPAPTDVGAAIVRSYPTLLWDTGVTAVTAGLGLVAGCVVGVSVAFAMTHSPATTRVLLPYVVALRIAPLVAVAPLVFLWFGRGVPARALLVGTLTIFPMTVATLDGLRSTPRQYVALARSVGASPAAVFLRIRVPAAAPSVFAGLELAATLSVIGTVIAEFLTLRAGLGYRVFVTADRLQTADSFAALTALSLLGIAFFLAPTGLATLAGLDPRDGRR